MLRDLRVRNFALLEELELSFESGLNVVTGETGAGKTILMSALGLAVGGRAASEDVRTGEQEARIEALFSVDRGVLGALEETLDGQLDLAAAESEFVVRRTIARSGRNRVQIGEAIATLGELERAGSGLIRIYGQHEHQTLRAVETHLGILDAFVADPAALERMREHYESWHGLAERIRRLSAGREAAAARAEYLRYQASELAEADPKSGEKEALDAERRILRASEKLAAAASFGEDTLYSGEAAAVAALQRVEHRLRDVAGVDARLDPILALVSEAAAIAEEAGTELRDYAARVTADPERLEEVEGRLALFEGLERKHACDFDGLVAKLAEIEQELADLDLGVEGSAALEADCAAAEAAARKCAKALSKKRRARASELSTRVEAELEELGMQGATLEARFEDAPLGPRGVDAVELYLSANPGEEPRPLARVASGGELSRITLAMKSVALASDESPTVIFDEVDSGIGGVVADAVGRKLAKIAESRQVLCITHLPQIAVYADHHYHVVKSTGGGRTRSVARRLSDEERREEVARMLGGETGAEALKHAETLLASARAPKPRSRRRKAG